MDDKYKIRDNETDEMYELRVSGYREADGYSWEELANIINKQTGNALSESTYRKKYRAYCIGKKQRAEEEAEEMADEIEEALETGDATDDLVQSIVDRTNAAAETFSLRREVRQDTRFERFYKILADRIDKCEPPKFKPLPTVDNELEWICAIADQHVGAKFSSVNNEYSVEIFKERMNKLLSSLKDFVRKNKIRKLNVLSLGDVIQGILRITDIKLNEIAVVDALAVAVRTMAEFLNQLSEVCEVVFYDVCLSNHPEIRYLGTKAMEFADEDMGKIFDSWIADKLANNKRIKIVSDQTKDYLEFNIGRFNCIAIHGHQTANIAALSKNLSVLHRKFYDYIFVGHSHEEKILTCGAGDSYDMQILVCPSVIGSDPYADKLMVNSKAACKLFGFDPEHGITDTKKIILN